MNIRLDVEKIIDIVQNINTKINNFPYNDDSHEEFDNLIESACHIIDDTITQNPLELSNPKFNDTLKDYVIHLLTELLIDVEEEYKLHYLLENVYNSAYNIYFSNIMPPRSYKTTYIRKIPNTKKMDEKIQYLKSKPQPDQRTQEWYLRRYNMITASNVENSDSQSNVNSIIYENAYH